MGTPMKVSTRKVKRYCKALSEAVGSGFSAWAPVSFLIAGMFVREPS